MKVNGKVNGKMVILSYVVKNVNGKIRYFRWDWSMIWILVKYRVVWGMNISFSVVGTVDGEEFWVRFFAE
jgi:hypothetical protein